MLEFFCSNRTIEIVFVSCGPDDRPRPQAVWGGPGEGRRPLAATADRAAQRKRIVVTLALIALVAIVVSVLVIAVLLAVVAITSLAVAAASAAAVVILTTVAGAVLILAVGVAILQP